MDIALLGLGRMGQALAERLLNDHDLTVWNRSRGKASHLVEDGATEAPNPGDAIDAADLVIVSLANDEAVRDLVLSAPLRKKIGSRVYVETSTISPALSRDLDRAFERFVALPVLGGPQTVRDGQAIYLAGGKPSVTEILAPVLDSLGGKHKEYPRPELASAGKLAVNLLLLSGIVTVAEALAIGRAGGLDDDQLTDLLCDSPMLAPGFKNRFQGILEGSGPASWTTVLAAKDARLGIELARAAGVDLRLASTVRDVYQRAVDAWMDEDDIVSVGRLYK